MVKERIYHPGICVDCVEAELFYQETMKGVEKDVRSM